jgi:hypothetical protein
MIQKIKALTSIMEAFSKNLSRSPFIPTFLWFSSVLLGKFQNKMSAFSYVMAAFLDIVLISYSLSFTNIYIYIYIYIYI